MVQRGYGPAWTLKERVFGNINVKNLHNQFGLVWPIEITAESWWIEMRVGGGGGSCSDSGVDTPGDI